MISKRVLAAAVLALAALPLSGAQAASDSYSIGGGAERCAYASGKVSGGTAWVEMCNSGWSEVSGEGTSAPTTAQPSIISGVIHVQTTRGVDHRTFKFDATKPDAPNVAQSFVMDPGMNTATLKITVSTITVNVTLTGKTEAPDPYWQAGSAQDLWNTMLFLHANAGTGVSRSATVAGSISSSTKGGGGLSAASGYMFTGVGADVCAVASPDFAFGFCDFGF